MPGELGEALAAGRHSSRKGQRGDPAPRLGANTLGRLLAPGCRGRHPARSHEAEQPATRSPRAPGLAGGAAPTAGLAAARPAPRRGRGFCLEATRRLERGDGRTTGRAGQGGEPGRGHPEGARGGSGAAGRRRGTHLPGSPSALVGRAAQRRRRCRRTPGREGSREPVPWQRSQRPSHKCQLGGASGLLPGMSADRMEAKTLGPVATPRKPVLSVSARKIKDNAADWHNLILKWDTLSDAGFAAANSIANLKISLLSKDKTESDSSNPASSDSEEQTRPQQDRELEALCEQLRATLGSLAKIQVKMEKLSSTTKGICELENYHYGEGCQRPPLFHTWPTAHFYEVSRQLADMYRKELLLKHTVGAELAHTADRDLILSYLSMWLHQPYVESSSKLHLEGMLLETGHRTL
ncbi:cyclin-dependent kinase 2-interacting protein [Ctenodactylus gundi]